MKTSEKETEWTGFRVKANHNCSLDFFDPLKLPKLSGYLAVSRLVHLLVT